MATRSSNKKKPTAKENATARVAERPRSGGKAKAKVPASQKQRSQGRFPGETPLTGEDRPKTRPGGKKEGQATARRGAGAAGRRTARGR